MCVGARVCMSVSPYLVLIVCMSEGVSFNFHILSDLESKLSAIAKAEEASHSAHSRQLKLKASH